MFRLVSAHDGPPECVVCFEPIDLHDKDDPAVSLSCDGQHIIHKYCWDKNAEVVAGRKCTCDEEPCCCRGVQCPLCRKPCDAQLLAPPSPGASSPASTAMADERASPAPGACFALLEKGARAGSGLEGAGGGFDDEGNKIQASDGDVSSMAAPEAEAQGADAVASAVRAELSEQGAAETSVEPAGADAVASAVGAELSEQGAAETSVKPAGADAVASAVSAELSEQGAAETSVEPAGADAVPELAYKPQASGGTQFADNTGVRVAGARRRRTEEAPPETRPVRRRPSGVSPDADTSAKAAGAARVRGVAKTSTAKARGVSTQGGADDGKKFHKPVCKRPARESSRPAATARPALGETSSARPAAGTSAAVADYPVASKGSRGRPQGSNGARRVDKLDAKYPWGREGGPPPASEAELQSLAEQMARLRIEAGNFARSGRADHERLAHAEAMLHIMRGKARAGFGGGRAVATHGLSLNRSAGLALAKRARKLALDLEAHFDPKAAPSVLIEEGIALMDAD